MDVGSLRHLVTIRAPIGVLHETDAIDVATDVRMSIDELELPFQQREQLNLGGLQTQTIYTAVCRYREDVRASYVLVESCCTQRTFQIVAMIPKRHEGKTEMTCVTSG
jgi:hypothetical protein